MVRHGLAANVNKSRQTTTNKSDDRVNVTRRQACIRVSMRPPKKRRAA